MNESCRRPEICSFCSLLCESPDDSPCTKRAGLLPLVSRRLESVRGDRSQFPAGFHQAVDWVGAASEVLVTGRIHSVESARACVELAKQRNGVLDPWDSDPAFDSIVSMQRVGGYSVSLAEARDHSDLWIVIGDDRLLEQTPRLPIVMNRGDSVPLLLLGSWSDASIQTWRAAGFEAWSIEIDLAELPKYLSQATRLGSDECKSQIGKWLLESKYTTLLYSPTALNVEYRDLWIDLISRWVLRRNQTHRVASLSWGSLQSSFHQTCTWLTGFPGRVRFENNSPFYDPSRHRAQDWCNRQQSSTQVASRSVLVWVDDSIEDLPPELLELDIPKVIIGPNPVLDRVTPSTWLPSGMLGVTHRGNVFRGDQTVLAKLGSVESDCSSACPSPADWIGRLTRCE